MLLQQQQKFKSHSDTEVASGYYLDILSNGFKIRTSNHTSLVNMFITAEAPLKK